MRLSVGCDAGCMAPGPLRVRQVVLDCTDGHDDPDEPIYVYADPAGHPFCRFVADPLSG
jgi:hypothetical protein